MNYLPNSLTTQFIDQELEDEYEKIKQELSIRLSFQGQKDGLLPKLIESQHFKVHVQDTIKHEIQSLINKCHDKHLPVSSIANARGHRSESKERIEIIEVLAKAAEGRYLLLLHECSLLKSGLITRISPALKIFILILFGFCEAFFSFTLLRSASFSEIFATILSFGLGFSAAWGMHLAARFIATTPTPNQKKVRHMIIIGIALVVTVGLGLWRATLSQEVTTTFALLGFGSASTHSTSALPYVLSSFILFIVGLSFELKTWISDAEIKKHMKYEERAKELEKVKKEWDDLVAEKHKLSNDALTASANSISRLEWASGFEQRLCNLADQLRSIYERTYLEHRIDGVCPKFFGTEKPWGFTVYFTEIFKNIKTQQS